MLFLIGAVVLGFAVARLNYLPRVIHENMGKISTFALILLLFSMGMSMGADPKITSNLPSLGGKALVLSLFTVLGSVFVVWLAVRLTEKKTGGKVNDLDYFS